jgi:hypothetical protein
MNTLREIGEYVGIPSGAGPLAPEALTLNPESDLRITLKKIANLLAGDYLGLDYRPIRSSRVGPSERRSMRALIEWALRRGPLSIDAEYVGIEWGRPPAYSADRALIVVRVLPTSGCSIGTFLSLYRVQRDGYAVHERLSGPGENLDADVARVVRTSYLPEGVYQVEVTRNGIGPSGYVILTKNCGHLVISRR